jgi:high-affinity nickel-transport protein
MNIDSLLALTHLGHGLLPSLLLVGLMGLRHGFDADHIAVVDGMTRARQLQRSYWSGRAVGLQFAAGHSVTILLASLLFFAYRTETPQWLDGLGRVISIVFLLVISVTNLIHALTPVRVDQTVGLPMGPTASLLLRLFGAHLHPVLVGVAFAISFDAMAQAAFFAARGGDLAGLSAVVLMAATFGIGMMLSDAVNGALIAWFASRSDQLSRHASRFSSAFVALIASATAVAAMAREYHEGFAQVWDQQGLWIGLGLVGFTVAIYALHIALQKLRLVPATSNS